MRITFVSITAVLAVLVSMAAFLSAAVPQNEAEITQSSTRVLFVTIKTSINPGTADYVERAIEEAIEMGAECVVIEMDTPGGLLESTRLMVQAILNADIPVAVFVAPRGARAGSAGVFITLAGHVAAMAPGTNIGAAHPVTGMGKDPEEEGGKHLAKKIENDTTAFIETIANQRKRNIQWAKQAVMESESITEEKALKINVIDLIANDRRDLLAKMHGRKIKLPDRTMTLNTKDAIIEDFDMSWKQNFVDFFSNPNIIYFLLLIASLGIYLELSNPGSILPGVAAGVAIILILLSAQSLPFNLAGILLMALGCLFFVLEVYVTSYGMLALGGIACFAIGSVLLFDPKDAFGFFGVSTPIIVVSTTVLAFVVGFTIYFIARAQLAKVSTGVEGMIGEVATVVNDLAPEGKVMVAGEYWHAKANHNVPKGQKVKVSKVDGMMLTVEPIEKDRSSTA